VQVSNPAGTSTHNDTMKQTFQHYDAVRDDIPHGAVLLFRPDRVSWRSFRWLWGIPIARLGRSEYCHAGMVERRSFEGRVPVCLEVLEGPGGRENVLSDVVDAHYPGQIDVYKVCEAVGWPGAYTPEGRGQRMVNRMRQLVALPYGWWDMFRIVLRHVPFLRLVLKTPTDDDNGRVQPCVCSGAVAKAVEAGGLDLVARLPASFVQPGDLARSPFLDYLCTLLPTVEGKPLTDGDGE